MTPEEIKAWRFARKLTQKEAAEMFGYRITQWQKFEYGTATVKTALEMAIRSKGKLR